MVTLDESLARAIREDWRAAPLDDGDRVMLAYVEKVTKDATAVSREDLAALRAAGFDDTGILQINLITSMFNYLNRVADGLGVGRP